MQKSGRLPLVGLGGSTSPETTSRQVNLLLALSAQTTTQMDSVGRQDVAVVSRGKWQKGIRISARNPGDLEVGGRLGKTCCRDESWSKHGLAWTRVWLTSAASAGRDRVFHSPKKPFNTTNTTASDQFSSVAIVPAARCTHRQDCGRLRLCCMLHFDE